MNKLSSCITVLMVMAAFMASSAQSSGEATYSLPELYNDDGDNFIVIAHRGASAYYPENTVAAFRGAVEMGAEMVELDVMMSSDGVPVVFHDARLDKHSSGSGLVSDHTLEELKKLDAGSWFSSEFAGEQIPTLEEALEYAKGKIAVNIEIKTEAVTDQVEGGVEEKSIALVKQLGMQNHVIFSSFDYRAVAHLKELDPSISAALLYSPEQSNKQLPSQLLTQYQADAFNCHYSQLSRKRLRDIRKHEIPVFVYTVNRERRMRKLIGQGVKGIFSDKPDLLKKVAEEVAQ